jgi:hypothetical protein
MAHLAVGSSLENRLHPFGQILIIDRRVVTLEQNFVPQRGDHGEQRRARHYDHGETGAGGMPWNRIDPITTSALIIQVCKPSSAGRPI